MTTLSLHARSAGEILDAAFQIYRSRWIPMVAATAVLVLPVLLIQAAAPLEVLPMLDAVSNLFFLAATAAVVVIASGVYTGRDVGAMEAVQTLGGRFFSVWGAAIVQGILIFVGLMLLVVPAFIFGAWTFAMQQAVMIEGRTAGDAFGRSRELARGHVKHILVTMLLAVAIVYTAVLGVAFLVGIAFAGERTWALALSLALVALNPITAVVGTVLYYDLRIRKEAFDVQVAADRLAEPESLALA